jgi:hypothetical protein
LDCRSGMNANSVSFRRAVTPEVERVRFIVLRSPIGRNDQAVRLHGAVDARTIGADHKTRRFVPSGRSRPQVFRALHALRAVARGRRRTASRRRIRRTAAANPRPFWKISTFGISASFLRIGREVLLQARNCERPNRALPFCSSSPTSAAPRCPVAECALQDQRHPQQREGRGSDKQGAKSHARAVASAFKMPSLKHSRFADGELWN